MIKHVHIRAMSDRMVKARLHAGHIVVPCLIGRSGRKAMKREGDGATPLGRFVLRPGFYRADRLRHPHSLISLSPLQRHDGWSDDIRCGSYNRHVRVPHPMGHESMWRTDSAYDIVCPTSHNERPRVIGLGSAIFFHLIRDGATHTEGCVAVTLRDALRLLPLLAKDCTLTILPSQGSASHPPQGAGAARWR